MKLTKIMMCSIFLLTSTLFAQPSKSQVIAKIKSGNNNIYKVDCSSPEKRFEEGIWKWYFGVRSYIHTEYTGVDRIYSTTVRYIGTKYEKTLVGVNSYTGMKNPSKETCLKLISEKKSDYHGYKYREFVEIVEDIHLLADPKFVWKNLNSTSFLVECTYKIKSGNNLQTVKEVKRVSLSRSVDGKSWDPQAKLLKMVFGNIIMLMVQTKGM